jgi:hypothetical protein
VNVLRTDLRTNSGRHKEDRNRAVRFSFSVDGVVGCEEFLMSAASKDGAMALAGVALGQQLMWLMLEHEYSPRSFRLLNTWHCTFRDEKAEAIANILGDDWARDDFEEPEEL